MDIVKIQDNPSLISDLTAEDIRVCLAFRPRLFSRRSLSQANGWSPCVDVR
jgi:hypothetical protein